jgi:Lon protease-like protein
MAVTLALFPLGTVLFPHMPLALHIFEERYREMMRDCLDGGVSFGVLGIREGRETGPGALPYEVGTLAQIRDVHELPDGRYHLFVVGASRFKVRRFSLQRAYLTGSVEYLQDRSESTKDVLSLAASVRGLFKSYRGGFKEGEAISESDLELVQDPELLSYLVAASLRVEVARRQELLEIDGVDERLRACATLLRRERGLAERLLEHRSSGATVSLN